MDFLRNGFLLILTIVVFSNCTGDASTKESADNICKCVQPLVELNVKMDALKNEAKIEELTQMMEQAGATEATAIKCAQESVDEKTNKEDLKKALNKSCGMEGRILEEFVGKL